MTSVVRPITPEAHPRGQENDLVMTNDVSVHLGEFGHAALDSLTQGRGCSAGTAVRTAVAYYLADRGSNRPAWRAATPATDGSEPTRALKISLDDESWTALADEAERQQVSPEVLARHALLYFLADLDSGRVAERVADALGES